MPAFIATDILKWVHLISFVLGGGGAMVCLLLLGLEESDPAYKGLSAALWRKVVTWGFRFAFITGLVILGMKLKNLEQPFAAYYLHIKLVLVVILLGVSETTTKSLAKGKRGGALLVIGLFLLTTFVVMTKRTYGGKVKEPAPISNMAAPALQAK